MSKKLYTVTKSTPDVITVFVVDEKSDFNYLAEEYCKQEVRYNNGKSKYILKELTSADQVPDGWLNAIYWGNNEEDKTVADWFKEISDADKEEKEFLKAKEIYERLRGKYEKDFV